MNVTRATPVVRIERIIPAAPETVFDAWLDPSSVARWMSPVGRAEAEIEPWVGGRLRITMIGPDVRIEHRGEYLELVRGRRLVFTWQSPYTGPQPSLVTVELEPVAAGTALTLTHARLPADRRASHEGGWVSLLERLSAELAGRPEASA
jgi:uncharacterized protein YndB with AHSA1/START domain